MGFTLVPKSAALNPKRGFRAFGAGCPARSDGHKSCLEAMAASGSASRPRTKDPKQGDMFSKRPLFALGKEVNGSKYLMLTGEMIKILVEDENKGVIKLPNRFGDKSNSETLPVYWSAHGIPMVLLMGLALGRFTSTDKGTILRQFKSLVSQLRDEDLELDVIPTASRIGRICQGMNVAVHNYITRGGGEDQHCAGPILNRLGNSDCMNHISSGIQNLQDILKDKSTQGTLKTLIGDQGPRRTYLNLDAPLYKTRSLAWHGIFNYAVTVDPGKNRLHGIKSLLQYADQLDLLLKQLALNIRICNKEHKTVEGKVTVSGVASGVVGPYGVGTAAATFTVPPRAA